MSECNFSMPKLWNSLNVRVALKSWLGVFFNFCFVICFPSLEKRLSHTDYLINRPSPGCHHVRSQPHSNTNLSISGPLQEQISLLGVASLDVAKHSSFCPNYLLPINFFLILEMKIMQLKACLDTVLGVFQISYSYKLPALQEKRAYNYPTLKVSAKCNSRSNFFN